MKTCFLYYASEAYESRAKILRTSIEKFYPSVDIYHEKPNLNCPIGTYIPGMAKQRLIKARDLLNNYQAVIVIGADCELFNRMDELDVALQHYNIVLVNHIMNPSSDKNWMTILHKGGHANADLMAFTYYPESIKALDWLISVTEGHVPSEGIFYEQTWLSDFPFLFDGVSIIRHPGYNVGYWDVNDRNITLQNGVWKAMGNPIKMVQYSGYMKGTLPFISKYSNIKVSGDVLELYKVYDERI